MSNALSVFAVTATLRNLLDRALRDNPSGTSVTTRPPDKARDNVPGNQLNIFLYHVTLAAAFRNMPVPGPVRGDTGAPPLPLCLHYLLTAYGENDDEGATSHRVLGTAMSTLHDHTLLTAEDMRAALGPGTTVDLQHQREGLRITHQPLSLEETSKLWTTFQTQYRVSAAYEVSVVLIDSARVTRPALPVLRRGTGDTGPDVRGDLVPRLPTVEAVTVPDPRGAAALGDTVVLTGHHLAGATDVRLAHPLLATPHELPVAPGGTDGSVSVVLPAAAAEALPTGAYTVQVVVPDTVDGQPVERTSNTAVLALGPLITRIAPPNPVTRDGAGAVTLTVTTTPDPRPGQRVVLLLGDHEIAPQPPPSPLPDPPPPPGTLEFVVQGLTAGTYVARVRVDGFDSRVVQLGSRPLRFDPAVEVVVA
jgi:hypothetical protein